MVDGTRKPAKGSAAGRVVRRAAAGAWNDDIFTESASAAFWQTLSLPPLLLGLFGILGYVGGWFGPTTVADVEQWIVTNTSAVFAPDPGGGEIVVTGTITRNPAAATASPVVSVTADDIQKRGITTVTEYLQTLSSNNAGTVPPGLVVVRLHRRRQRSVASRFQRRLHARAVRRHAFGRLSAGRRHAA